MRTLAALIALAVITRPADVFARACCDGHTRTDAIAWSTSGGTVLLRTDQMVACELSRFLSVRRTGAKNAIVCYDLRGDANKRIAWDKIEQGGPSKLAATARRFDRLGLAKHRKGDFLAAIDEFVYALRSTPQDPRPRYNLACAMARLGRKNRALVA